MTISLVMWRTVLGAVGGAVALGFGVGVTR